MEGTLKKAFLICIFSVVCMPLIVEAVTWQMDSSPFTFPVTGVLNGSAQITTYQLGLKSRYDGSIGIVTFSFNLPSQINKAKLSVYNCGGVLVQKFDLLQGSSFVQWNVSRKNVKSGIYLASLSYGNVEKNIKISIDK